MFAKLLEFCVAFALLAIATESSADTVEIIEIDPQQFVPQNQNGQCQQMMNYYDNYYKQAYSKYYNEYYFNYYKKLYANYMPAPNVDLGGAKVEWVCINPQTKDQMVIGSKDVVVNNGQQYYPVPNYPQQGGHHYPPQQNYPPQQGGHHYPPQQGGHHYPPPATYPPQQGGHHHHQPPPQENPQPSFPSYPSQNPTQGGHNQPTQKPAEPQTDKPHNTNGEGLIDIRFGDE